MTSLGTDFETHAIWQRYIDDPTGKVFVARNARTIVLYKVQGTWQSTFIHKLEIPLGFLPGLYCIAQWAYVMQESVGPTIFVSKKGIIRIRPMDVCTRNLWLKAERGKITGSESTTRFPQASCFEKPTRSVPELWGRMYNVLARSANGTRNGTRNWIPVQPRKAQRN